MRSIRPFLQEHREEVRVFGFTAGLAFFFTHGLPLWDDDYRVWLEQARTGVLELLLRTLSPITSEPQTWGYGDRPLQALVYRILSVVFGTWGPAYYFVKSLAFGGLCLYFFRQLRALKVGRDAAYVAIGLFALSTNVLVSLLWHSDFSVYSQLLIAALFTWSLRELDRLPHDGSLYARAWREGLRSVPRDFLRFSGLFFAAVYFGAKFRGDFRIVPVVLLTYLFVYRRDKFRAYLPPFALAFLATLPWSSMMFETLPPWLPGGGDGIYARAGEWTYSAFSLPRLFDFIIADAFNLSQAPLSIMGAIGVTTLAALAVFASHRASRHELRRPDENAGFLLIWLGVSLFACTFLSRQGEDSGAPLTYASTYSLRYTFLPLVPAMLLVARVLNDLLNELGGTLLREGWGREQGRRRWVRAALMVALSIQGGLALYRDCIVRRDMGHIAVAVDRAFVWIEKFHPTASVVHLPTFQAYGFRPSTTRALSDRKALAAADDIVEFPAETTYALSWGPTLDTRYTLENVVPGCGYSLFDLIFPCSRIEGAMLLRYLGNASEVVQGEQFERQGNLIAARDTLDSYVRRDPGNHGAAFELSLLNYRLKDFQRMEQIYDHLGPFFPHHPAVVYNWGLSKQSVQKFREASELLERAYAMVPKDYGIGYNLAESYFRQGKKSRALATLGELMRRYPDDPAMKSMFAEWNNRKPANAELQQTGERSR